MQSEADEVGGSCTVLSGRNDNASCRDKRANEVELMIVGRKGEDAEKCGKVLPGGGSGRIVGGGGGEECGEKMLENSDAFLGGESGGGGGGGDECRGETGNKSLHIDNRPTYLDHIDSAQCE
jgi:hypothetical protein